jgi:hypothetical protein
MPPATKGKSTPAKKIIPQKRKGAMVMATQDAASARSRKIAARPAAESDEDEDDDELEGGSASGEEGGSVSSASGLDHVEESPAKTPEVRPVAKKQKVII